MDSGLTVRSSMAQALAHVAVKSSGGPIDPDLRVTLNFHPDRLASGVPILGALCRDGLYRSQFETGTSNGGLAAYEGGDRWSSESRIFGTAYDVAPPEERPKYGSLNFRRRAGGGSPRFGSSHLRLRRETLARTTFCYPDSYLEPVNFGGTDVERLAAQLGCPVEWHGGFRLSTDILQRHPDFRGPEYVQLGIALAEDGHLDPRIIGDASRSRRYDDQDLKRVWHYVARFGSPA